jgi:hypothetical protein
MIPKRSTWTWRFADEFPGIDCAMGQELKSHPFSKNERHSGGSWIPAWTSHERMAQAPEQAMHAFRSPRKSLLSGGQTQGRFPSRDRTSQRIDSTYARIWSQSETDTGGLPSDVIASGPLPPPRVSPVQIARTAVNPWSSWINRAINWFIPPQSNLRFPDQSRGKPSCMSKGISFQ